MVREATLKSCLRVRCPSPIFAAIQHQAAIEKRTDSNMILFLLEQGLSNYWNLHNNDRANFVTLPSFEETRTAMLAARTTPETKEAIKKIAKAQHLTITDVTLALICHGLQKIK